MLHRGIMLGLALGVLLPCATARLAAQHVPGGSLRIGLDGGVSFPGDELSGNGLDRPAHATGGLAIEYTLTRALGLQLSWSGGLLQNSATGLFDRKFRNAKLPAGFQTFDRASYESSYFGVTLGAMLRVPFIEGVSPFIMARGGLFGFSTTGMHDDRQIEYKGQSVTIYGAGGGVEVALSRSLAARLTYVASMTTSDLLDAFEYGSGRDGLASLTLGVVWTLPLGEKFGRVSQRAAASPEGLTSSDLVVASDDDDASLAAGTADPTRRGDERPGPSLRPVAASGVTATLDARDVAVFGDYAQTPDVLTLTVQHRSADPLRLRTRLEVLHEGRAVAEGRGTVLLMQPRAQFDARSFIDVDSLVVQPAYRFAPAEGRYEARVHLFDDADAYLTTAVTSFDHLDLERTFGVHGARVRYLLTTRTATVERCDERRICFDTFIDGENPLAPTSQRHLRLAGTAGPRATGAMLNDPEDALTLFPPTVLYGDRDAYLVSLVRNAVSRAQVIASARAEGLQYVGRPDAVDAIDVVVARVYFGEGSGEASSDMRQLLGQLTSALPADLRGRIVLAGSAVSNEQGGGAALASARVRAVAALLGGAQPSASERVEELPATVHPATRQEARRVDVLLRFEVGK